MNFLSTLFIQNQKDREFEVAMQMREVDGMEQMMRKEQDLELAIQMRQAELQRQYLASPYGYVPVPNIPTQTKPPDIKFKELKESVKQIEAEPFESGARKRIESKINRLQRAGATNQALILEGELTTIDSLVRLKEWDYKLLTKQEIDRFQENNKMTLTEDGLKLHIDLLEKYCGNPQTGQAKDRIIPDPILEKLEEAQERELFDEFAVLWAEKVKDPLVLGLVVGCEDYFLIAEFGDDISFEQIAKGEYSPEQYA